MKRIFAILLLLLPFQVFAQYPSECFCVTYARELVPSVPQLDANEWYLLPLSTRSVPEIGGIILLQYESVWHVAVITDFTESGFQVSESNYIPCTVDDRIIPYNDSRIRAFFNFH